MPAFHWTSLHVSFAFADFALYPFTVVNHGHENNYMLSCENASYSTPTRSLKLGMVWGTLTHFKK